ncbi:flagellar hook-basal body complex protein FliE [Telmatospirillum sp. J64-1]|uniref:flagellar hook-basal body complex protein FliE n=1 Tax=Telmatospirillum sp. J64-1 TaxID=2502183 RepID=UPI00115EA50B|nr:flagellar hook-basal body complex protein FliE [Telmatospirillum sp. J64-1]
MIKISDAVAAYAAVAQAPVTQTSDAGQAAGGGFADMVKDAARTAVDNAKEGERMSQQAIAGKADIREVVNAVTNAELTLDTVVAVRDKVVTAYKEIMQMPI